ncbi:MAG: hypothetical protein AAFV93_17740, partial [Chloroflexota bacterium]
VFMKNCPEISVEDVVRYGLSLCLAISTRQFENIKEELGLFGTFSDTDSVKRIVKDFCMITLPMVGSAISYANVPSTDYDEQKIMLWWQTLTSELERLDSLALFCEWLIHIYNLSVELTDILPSSDVDYTLIQWATDEITLSFDGLCKNKFKDLKIATLQYVVKRYKWSTKFDNVYHELDLNEWEKYLVKSSKLTWTENCIRRYQFITMWKRIYALSENSDIEDMQRILTEYTQKPVDLVSWKAKLSRFGYL